MLILKIYLGISVLCFGICILQMRSWAYEVKDKVGNIPKKRNKDWAGEILALIKLAILSIIPMFNVIMVWKMLFYNEEIKDKIINKVVENIKGGNNENNKDIN